MVQDIIRKMTLEDKIKLCSGATFWESEEMEEYQIPSFFMSDGPHGLRTQKGEGDHLGVNKSEVSTCFPTACASSATWNVDLLEKMGKAIGEEALHYGVDVVLGPGANMKRNPLCGRNFEYFSEDPYLAGKLASSWIQGVQSNGVGTSLKHFAANSQEQERLNSDSMVDERALREIYLAAFETAVKESQPATIMCSYNKINGAFSSDNKKLLTDILRDEWGFKGLVVTDWGALNNRVDAFKAGCDLEMPYSAKMFDKEVKEAVESGELDEKKIDECVERILNLAFYGKKHRKDMPLDKVNHHLLAKQIATEGAVLLKNEDAILPIDTEKKVVLCGLMADETRYQGAGSSHINPYQLSNIKDSISKLSSNVSYYKAYGEEGAREEEELLRAVEAAKGADVAVVVIGLPDSYESEGYDRTHMNIPEAHQELLKEVSKVNENVVVVLLAGSPVEMPWINQTKAILNMYLGGQAVGEACADLLFGVESPSGKLAETYPMSYKDVTSSETFGVNPRQVEYAESIYMGYRYYDKANKEVLFPFGYGLSYTTFEYSDLTLSTDKLNFNDNKEQTVTLSVKIKNTGKTAGSETVQVYVADKKEEIFKAVRELKGFAKLKLEPGEEKEVKVTLDYRSFAHYDVKTSDWEVLSGAYDICVGASSRDIRLQQEIAVEGTKDVLCYENIPTWYVKPEGKPSIKDFEVIYGKEIKPYQVEQKGQYTMLNSLNDLKGCKAVAQYLADLKAEYVELFGDENAPDVIFLMELMPNMPIIRYVQQRGGEVSIEEMQALVKAANEE